MDKSKVSPFLTHPVQQLDKLNETPVVPCCWLSTYGRRAFSIAGPTVWNSLPDELIDPAHSFDSFRQFLKTILFSLY